MIFFITTFGFGILCLCGRRPRESTLEEFDEWYNSKYPKDQSTGELREKPRNYTLEEFDEWYYSKYPKVREPEGTEETVRRPKEYTLEEFDEWYYSKYPKDPIPEDPERTSRTYIDVNGYRRYSDSHRLVHVHVAEVFVIKRKLRRDEVVHHINGDKLDNRAKNLKVMSWQEHQKLHGRGLRF